MRRLFALWEREGGHAARREWQPSVIRYSHLLSAPQSQSYISVTCSILANWEGGHVARRGRPFWFPNRFSPTGRAGMLPAADDHFSPPIDSHLLGGRACCPPRTTILVPRSILTYWEGGHVARRGRQHAVPPKSVHGLRTTPLAVLPSISNTTSRQYGSDASFTSCTIGGPFSAVFHETTDAGERRIRIEPL
jgi:hypothetical protein